MQPLLEVEGLKKTYPSFQLNGVSFSIYEDCITGFIGANGAGKTTTICLKIPAKRRRRSIVIKLAHIFIQIFIHQISPTLDMYF